MIKIYTLFSLILVTALSQAQVAIIMVDDPGNTYNGTVVPIVTNSASKTVYMKCKNISGAAFEMKFRRVIMSSTATFTDQFCDNVLCYPLAGQGNDWTAPNPNPISDTDTSDMKPIYDFTGGGDIYIRYYVLDGSNGDAVIDSIDFEISSALGYEESSIEVSSFPNPASDVFNIELGANGSTSQVIMYNVIGKEVMRKTLANGLNTLDVKELNNGVYFYSILNKNDIIETKKLVVRH